jgi:6-methylsalicylate decarboxylase
MSCLKRLHYDTANAGSDLTLSSTLHIVGPSHLLYGSDWPWAPAAAVSNTIQDLEASR